MRDPLVNLVVEFELVDCELVVSHSVLMNLVIEFELVDCELVVSHSVSGWLHLVTVTWILSSCIIISFRSRVRVCVMWSHLVTVA